MAWRIEHCVERGEIDNRERGGVTGRIWLAGREEPLELDLAGNPHADLAGRRLIFRRRDAATAAPAGLMTEQRGEAGDLTASRKCRVFDVPVHEALEQIRLGVRPPEHIANTVYLEWFSEGNGRVVIESAEFDLEISAPEWAMTPAEEQAALEAAAGAFTRFMGRPTQAVEERRVERPEDHEWTEFDYEKLMRESDARTDKYGELLEKYGHGPEAEKRIAREMGWVDDTDETPAGGRPMDSVDWEEVEREAAELQPDPATEGRDWIRTEGGDIRHPLAHRAQENALRLTRELREQEDHLEFCFGYQMTAAKLAGALNSLAYDGEFRDGAFIVAYLKRALGHLHEAQAALEREQAQVDPTIAERVRAELFSLREDILALTQEFRSVE